MGGRQAEGPERKRHAGSEGKRAAESPDANPFGPRERKWLTGAIRAGLEAFGGHVETRLAVVEAAAADAQTQATQAAASVAESRSEVEALRVRLEEVERQVARAAERAGPGDGVASAVAALQKRVEELEPRGPQPTPWEQRTLGRLGNVGWDLAPQALQTRATELLQQAGVPATLYTVVAPNVNRDGVGSTADVHFATAEGLQRARLLVRAARISTGDQRILWLDVRRERCETRPARMVHRAAEFLGELEKSQPAPRVITKNVRLRTVDAGADRMVWVVAGAVQTTAAAKARYGAEELALLCSFAAEE